MKKDGTFKNVTSSSISVGDIIKIHQNERVPADCVLLYTTEKNGSIFIRTDQLDGETDWKLRKAIGYTQKVAGVQCLVSVDGHIVANPPNNQIYDFQGYFETKSKIKSANVATESSDE